MAATATPGLPIVVTTFVKGTSRPAAGPDKTLIAARGDSPLGCAGKLVGAGGVNGAGAPEGARPPGPALASLVVSRLSAGASLTNLILYLPTSTASPS